MTSARYLLGDTRTVVDQLPADSVDLVLTSPPFLALRSYLPADHPDKHLEMGSEPNPGEFIDALIDLVERLDRVLAPHGSMCIELGDTYAGSGGAGGDYNTGGLREGQQAFRQRTGWHRAGAEDPDRYRSPGAVDNGRPNFGDGWPDAKSLCLIPELFRLTLAYGVNPLTGRQTPRWRVRNVVRWCRPNPPVGALGDKFRPATSDMVIIAKARDRYFDLDAVRTATESTKPGGVRKGSLKGTDARRSSAGESANMTAANPAGAPPLDHWIIPTQPYAGSHYATYPEQLCITPIKAMCPLKVCRTCGTASKRVVELAPGAGGYHAANDGGKSTAGTERKVRTVLSSEWSDCGHDNWRTGLVLDPFAGSGTTLQVATGHGRDAIGIDLDERNADLALERVGPLMLTVEDWRTREEAA